jgi:hypothetical protein
MPSNAAYLLYGKIPVLGWEILYPKTEACIRNQASFGSAERLKDLPLNTNSEPHCSCFDAKALPLPKASSRRN